MSILLTKTTRRGKTIVVSLTQDEDKDRISITVDGETTELDEDASDGRPVHMDPKTEKNMGLEPGAVSFGTTVLTAKEYQEMNQTWSEQSPRYQALHQMLEDEKQQTQAKREDLETTLQQANRELDEMMKKTGDDQDALQENLIEIAQMNEKIDQAASELRKFDAQQKARQA